MTSQPTTKLSNRLTVLCQAIASNSFSNPVNVTTKVHDHFDHIWDCCCDHGYLGQQLLIEQPESHIHFVDVVPHLIDEVTTRLNTSSEQVNQSNSKWSSHCMDAAEIPLDSEQSHLVMIAGVGGDLLIEMVESIVANHPSLMTAGQLSFLLCPVRQLHKVREGLNRLNLGLVSEQIVKDKQLFYEVIMASNQSTTNVSQVGDSMWDLNNKDHVEYRDTMIKHYSKQPTEQAKSLLALYQGIS